MKSPYVARVAVQVRYTHHCHKKGKRRHRQRCQAAAAGVRFYPFGPVRALIAGTFAVSQVKPRQPSCQPSWIVRSRE